MIAKRRFGEDNIIRLPMGDVVILPSYNPDNPYPYYQAEYFWPRDEMFDYYDPISRQVVLMDGMVSGEGNFSEAIEQGIVTQEDLDWIENHSKWILYGAIGFIALLMLTRRRRGEVVLATGG